MILIIGLTGSFKTGKSTVSTMFDQLGAQIIDADLIVHQLLQNHKGCIKKIVNAFGQSILQNTEIHRSVLAKIVFRDKRKLRQLERIIHPYVRQEIMRKIQNFRRMKKSNIVVLDIPLLFESKIPYPMDLSIVVQSQQRQQIERAKKQLGLSRAATLQRIRSQMPLREKIKRADYVIDNSQSKASTRKQVKKIWQELCQKIKL